jgi:restriction system protein
MANAWMVRAGQGGRYFDFFRNLRIVAIGWKAIGDISRYDKRRDLAIQLRVAIPNYSEGTALVASGQLFRFANEIKIGDRIVTYDPRARSYLCGMILGDYVHEENGDIDELSNRRAVSWEFERSRDELSVPTKNTLGSILTLFQVAQFAEAELWRERQSTRDARPEAPCDGLEVQTKIVNRAFELADATFQQIQEQANERIKDRIAALSWSDMQELVAGLLRAMGYVAKVSPPGPDRGRDIIASPDGLGFQEPRIVVEVKHRLERMGAPEIRKFLGGRKPHEKGLFVSTGGFTPEAHYEAERASIPLTLLDSEQLIEFLLLHYSRLDEKIQ